MTFIPAPVTLPDRSQHDIPSPASVCQLAPCTVDGPCPLTGARCSRPYPWRRTPEAVMEQVISHADMAEALANPLQPQQKQQHAPARRRVPFTPTIPGI